MAGFANELFAGTTLQVETALGSTTINLEEEVNAPPGLVTQFLQPRYTLKRGNTVLLVKQPLGRPEERRELLVLAVVALVVLGVVLATK